MLEPITPPRLPTMNLAFTRSDEPVWDIYCNNGGSGGTIIVRNYVGDDGVG